MPPQVDADTAVTTPAQILVVGGSPELGRQVAEFAEAGPPDILHVPAGEWASTDWQQDRQAGTAWAVLVLGIEDGRTFKDCLHCTQLVSLSFRPARLLIVADGFSQEQVLFLLKAGATHFLHGSPDPERIFREIQQPGIRHEKFFPDPVRWLTSLVRAAEELGLHEEPLHQIKKLIRIFAAQLKVDRASVSLVQEGELFLVAAIGMPPEVQEGMKQKVAPGSISEWVMQNRRGRLIEGEYTVPNHPKSEARSAVCAPLHSGEELFGIVCFTSLRGGRLLNQADLATAEVFASLLALAISNQSLHRELIEKERLATVGATISSITHCIKNLLTILKGSSMILQMGLDKQDFGQLTSGVQMTGKGIKRLESLALDLLDFCKNREPACTPSDIAEEIRAIEDAFTVMNMHRKHRLSTQCSVPGKCLLDQDRFQRAVLNLVNNSMDATPEGGQIAVRARREQESLILSVEDDGPGVPEEKLADIFAPFYSTKGSKGTGLGLAMVSKFCEESGGTVEAGQSENLGGLRITIKLPWREHE